MTFYRSKLKDKISDTKKPFWLVPFLCLLGVGGLLGLSTNMAKFSSNIGLNPITLLIWSISGATVLLSIILGLQGRLPRLSKQLIEYSVIASLLGVVGPNLILFAAVPKVGAGFVTLSISFPPILTYIGTLSLGIEKFQFSRAIGVALSLAGAAFMAILKLTAPDAALFWIILTLLIPIFLSIGNIYRTLRWPHGAKTEELALAMLITSSIMLFASGLLGDLPLSIPIKSMKPLLIIGVQAIIFALQYLLFFTLQKKGGPVYLSLLGSVAAIVGVPIAVFFLGESIPEGLLIGSILISIGIFLVIKKKRKETRIVKNALENQIKVKEFKRNKPLISSKCS